MAHRLPARRRAVAEVPVVGGDPPVRIVRPAAVEGDLADRDHLVRPGIGHRRRADRHVEARARCRRSRSPNCRSPSASPDRSPGAVQAYCAVCPSPLAPSPKSQDQFRIAPSASDDAAGVEMRDLAHRDRPVRPGDHRHRRCVHRDRTVSERRGVRHPGIVSDRQRRHVAPRRAHRHASPSRRRRRCRRRSPNGSSRSRRRRRSWRRRPA